MRHPVGPLSSRELFARFVSLVKQFNGFVDGSSAYFPDGNRAEFVKVARERGFPIRH